MVTFEQLTKQIDELDLSFPAGGVIAWWLAVISGESRPQASFAPAESPIEMQEIWIRNW